MRIVYNGGEAYYDLQNGALGTTSAIDANIEQVGATDWYRCSFAINEVATIMYIYPARW